MYYIYFIILYLHRIMFNNKNFASIEKYLIYTHIYCPPYCNIFGFYCNQIRLG